MVRGLKAELGIKLAMKRLPKEIAELICLFESSSADPKFGTGFGWTEDGMNDSPNDRTDDEDGSLTVNNDDAISGLLSFKFEYNCFPLFYK